MGSRLRFDPATKLNFAVFEAEVGRISIALPLSASFARHRMPGATLGYFHPNELEMKAAAAFVNDLIRGTTEDLMAKWFLPEAFSMFMARERHAPFDTVPWMIVRKSVIEGSIPHGPFSKVERSSGEPFMTFFNPVPEPLAEHPEKLQRRSS